MTSREEELQQNINAIDVRIEAARKAGSHQLAKRLLCRRSGYEAELANIVDKKYVVYVPPKRANYSTEYYVAVVFWSGFGLAFWAWMVWALYLAA